MLITSIGDKEMGNDQQEIELLEGFRKLGAVARNTVLTAVSLAVTAEDAVRQEINIAGESAKDSRKEGK